MRPTSRDGMSDPAPPSDTPPTNDEAEFSRLPPPPRARSPVVAIAVLAVGVLVLFRLADDTRYALSSRTPIDLGDARSLKLTPGSADPHLRDNLLVTVSGLPDRRHALLFEPKGEKYRRAFYRLLGTSGRLLVRAEQTSERGEGAAPLEDRFTGRLRPFRKLSFADQIRDYYGTRVQATRFLERAAVAKRFADPTQTKSFPARLPDRGGETVELGAADELFLEVDFPEDLLVSLPSKQFPVEDDARHELARLGAPVGPSRPFKEGYVFTVRLASERRDAFLGALDERGFPFHLRRERFVVKLADLGPGQLPDEVTFFGQPTHPKEYVVEGNQLVSRNSPSTTLPWSRVASVQIAAPVAIPEDAWIIVEGDRPEQHQWVLLVNGLLILFLAFNGWLLFRILRAPKAAPQGEDSEPAAP